MSALYVMEQFGRETSLLVLPADHLVQDRAAFAAAVAAAEHLAGEGLLVTFGIIPDAPKRASATSRRGRIWVRANRAALCREA